MIFSVFIFSSSSLDLMNFSLYDSKIMIKSQDLKKYHLPDSPGVYFFKSKKEILYIGKATSLKDRVKSYFSSTRLGTSDLFKTRGPLIVDLIFKADKISFIKTDSVLEAIILEANLIKKYQPKYNTKEKSDKSFNYVVITKEEWPRILIKRGRNLLGGKSSPRLNLRPTRRFNLGDPIQTQSTFGPFPNSTQLKEALKIIRKIFSFRDKCLPYNYISKSDNRQAIAKLLSTPRPKKPCFNYQLGLCPGVCIGAISKKDYQKNIKNIKLFFVGQKKQIIKNLKKEMKALAKVSEYEKAGEIRNKIFALKHILDVALIKEEHDHPVYQNSHPSLGKEGKGEVPFSPPILRRSTESARGGGIFRIEAYDVAHLFGSNNVGVMVVWEDGELKKSDYRKFKIRNSKGNDIGALQEILERRLKHTEWPGPDLIVVDGGSVQYNLAKKILDQGLTLVQTVAVTKDDKHKPKGIIGLPALREQAADENIIKKYKKEILLINNEAHRFALAFHRQKRNVIL